MFRKSIKRKSLKRKSLKRKSLKRKSLKRKSLKRKSLKRKSLKRKSLKRKLYGGMQKFNCDMIPIDDYHSKKDKDYHEPYHKEVNNIGKGLDPETRKSFRKSFIKMVLSPEYAKFPHYSNKKRICKRLNEYLAKNIDVEFDHDIIDKIYNYTQKKSSKYLVSNILESNDDKLLQIIKEINTV